jgi:hypothetical protein
MEYYEDGNPNNPRVFEVCCKVGEWLEKTGRAK